MRSMAARFENYRSGKVFLLVCFVSVLRLLTQAETRPASIGASEVNRVFNQALTNGAWQLVWSDEFSGPSASLPDRTKWAYDTGRGNPVGWGNSELENYTSNTQNVHTDGGGHLVISAIKSGTGSSATYTSARIKTMGLFSFQYGMIEASMNLPSGNGLWPAFWMLGTNITSVHWPACGEVDIMENINRGMGPTAVQSTLHGPYQQNATASFSLGTRYNFPAGQNIGQFHVYGMIWSPQQVQFFVDDPVTNIFATFTTNDVMKAGGQWVFDHPFFLVLNLAVGSTNSWSGGPDATTPFPANMLVDYVRVYQWNASPAPAQIQVPPTSVVTSENSPVYFSVTATGAAPLVYHWFFNGGLLTGATNSDLSVPTAGRLAAGTYQVIVSNLFGSATSSTVTLSITGVPASFDPTRVAVDADTGLFRAWLVDLTGQGPVEIDASTNLLNWSPVATNPSGFGQAPFVDPSATNFNQRFYRALVRY